MEIPESKIQLYLKIQFLPMKPIFVLPNISIGYNLDRWGVEVRGIERVSEQERIELGQKSLHGIYSFKHLVFGGRHVEDSRQCHHFLTYPFIWFELT